MVNAQGIRNLIDIHVLIVVQQDHLAQMNASEIYGQAEAYSKRNWLNWLEYLRLKLAVLKLRNPRILLLIRLQNWQKH